MASARPAFAARMRVLLLATLRRGRKASIARGVTATGGEPRPSLPGRRTGDRQGRRRPTSRPMERRPEVRRRDVLGRITASAASAAAHRASSGWLRVCVASRASLRASARPRRPWKVSLALTPGGLNQPVAFAGRGDHPRMAGDFAEPLLHRPALALRCRKMRRGDRAEPCAGRDGGKRRGGGGRSPCGGPPRWGRRC